MLDRLEKIFLLAGYMPKIKVNTTTLVQATIRFRQKVNHRLNTVDR